MILQAEPTSHPITALAEARLKASPYQPIRNIGCEFDDGLLVLQGRLPSYFYKQMAQVAVADIVGIEQVVNQIEVWE